MKTRTFCKLVTLPLLLVSCVTDGELEPEDVESDIAEDSTDPAASTLCVVPPTPPPADATWILPPSRIQTIEDYGTGACAAYTLAVRNVEDISAKPMVTANTADACVGTSITMRRYRFNAGWSFVSTETVTGVWTYQGCRLPSVGWHADTTGEVRVHVKAKQTVCAGQYCGTSYALPIKISADTYAPPPPPTLQKEPAPAERAPAEKQSTDAASAALCFVPPTPPAANVTFDLDAIQNPFIYAVQNYGTGECSAHTSSWLGHGSFKAYVTEPATADACVGTTFYVRRYLRDYAGWQLWDTRTIHGEWTANGCVTDRFGASVGGTANWPTEIRLHVKVHRTTCAGQFCGTQYGVPFRLSGTPD